MDKSNKLRDNEFGKFAETKAKEWYTSRGYAIRETNWHCHRIEIDLIVQKDTTMVFVEVKARSGKDMDALEAVTPAKIKRISRGADIYLNGLPFDYEYRFDIVTLTGDFSDYLLEVYEDAFLSPLTSK